MANANPALRKEIQKVVNTSQLPKEEVFIVVPADANNEEKKINLPTDDTIIVDKNMINLRIYFNNKGTGAQNGPHVDHVANQDPPRNIPADPNNGDSSQTQDNGPAVGVAGNQDPPTDSIKNILNIFIYF